MNRKVEEFLASKNDATRAHYRRAFDLFLVYTRKKLGRELTGKEFLEMVAEDRRADVAERRHAELGILKGFFEWLRKEAPKKKYGKKGFALKTCHKFLTALTEFMNYNDLTVNKRKLGLPRATRQPKNRKMNIRREEVRKLVDHATANRDKALILCMWQSGMGIGDLLSLNAGDVLIEDPVRGSLDDPPLLVELVREKSGVEYKTLFGMDACEALKRYLDERGRMHGKVRREAPLFIEHRKRGGKLERLRLEAVDMMFRRLARRSGLVSEERMKEADLNPARPHALRAGFSSALKEDDVNQDVVDGLMGHSVSYDSAYHNFSDKQLRELYKRHEDILSIGRVSVPKEDEIKSVIEEHFGKIGVERVMPELKRRVHDLDSRVSKVEREVKRKRALSERILAEAIRDPEFRKVIAERIDKSIAERIEGR